MIYAKLNNGNLDIVSNYVVSGDVQIINPTAEQLTELGYKRYIKVPAPECGLTQYLQHTYKETTDEITDVWLVFTYPDEQITLMRQGAYKEISDPMFIAYQHYLAIGEEEKAEQAREAWLEKVQEIKESYPYNE